jgi:alginate O-acetyltransferase complex protein AlgI
MAIGLGLMFGINFPINFASPYKAKNIIEFWRSWHITLSRFLKDYLYIPLGGNRKGKFRRYLNLGLTMLLGGLWHGASWNFVIWGGLHGIYLCLNHAFRFLVGNRFSKFLSGKTFAFFSWFLTSLSVVFAWVFFRAETLQGAMGIFRGMFNMNGVSLARVYWKRFGDYAPVLQDLIGLRFEKVPYFYGVKQLAWIFLALVIAVFLPSTQEILSKYAQPLGAKIKEKQKRLGQLFLWQPSMGWMVWILFILVGSVLSIGKVKEFLYFNF